jgi:putative redox protein
MGASSYPITGRSVPGATQVELAGGTARWRADLTPAAGGAGRDPDPHDLLDSALVACTILTLQLYAKRKNYPLESVEVSVTHDESGGVYRMRREVKVSGALDVQQRADLLRVANACPIHKALHATFEIGTEMSAD